MITGYGLFCTYQKLTAKKIAKKLFTFTCISGRFIQLSCLLPAICDLTFILALGRNY